MTTLMFPGQGSQIKGMGKALFPQFPNEVKQINELLSYSIEELCLEDPKAQLRQTEFTQVALYVVEALSYLAQASTLKISYVLGHSLGEYSALFAAGCFDLMQGLRLVQKRGQLMAKAQGGAMLAVLSLSEEHIWALLESESLNSIEIAAYNSKKQIVLSGSALDIVRAKEILSKEASLCILLPVSGAFHSAYMQDAALKFETFLNPFKCLAPQTPVIANVTARPYLFKDLKKNLVQQLTHPVQWTKSIHFLKEQGETEFIEIGPGQVLSRLMKDIS